MTAATPTPWVLPLSALRRADLEVAGGKAANLGELIAAGLPVPEGFCLTTSAWAAMVQSGGEELARALAALASAPEDPERLRSLALAAREAVERAPVPDAVRAACREAYAALEAQVGSGVPVAVRSSATAEDLPDASFAGQQETVLNVVGAEAVLAAVQRCWGSLFTERAVAYRQRQRIDPRTVALAVVVQRLVPSEVAGVLFTADPVSGRRDRAVVDASPGLGEAVVSGAVNPDHFLLDAATGEVLAAQPGDKRVAIVAEAEGGTRRVEREASSEVCVSPAELRSLAALGQRIEQHFGHPQDVEWALGPGRQPFILQSRPITTLFPIPTPAPFPGDRDELRVFFNFAVAQGVLRPMTPMGLSVWKLIAGSAEGFLGAPPANREAPPVMTEAARRLFLDVTPLVRSDLGRKALHFVLSRMEARTSQLMQAAFEEPRLSARPVSRAWLAPRLLRIAARTRIPLRAAHAMLFPAAARQAVRQAAEEALRPGVQVPTDPAGALDFVEQTLARALLLTFFRAGPVFLAGMASLQVVCRLLGDAATPEELDAVLRGLPFNVTTEMDLALARLARDSRADLVALDGIPARELAARYLRGELPPTLQAGLAAFLKEWGARGVAEIDLGVPRWREDPTQLLGSIAAYAAADPGAEPEQQFRRSVEEAEAMVAELTRRAHRLGWLRGKLTAFLLSRVRLLAGLRESPKFYIVRVFDRARRVLTDIGRSLHAEGRLSAPDGVFFLSLTEVRQAVGGASLVPQEAQRREEAARELGRRHLPRVMLSDGTEVRPTGSEPEGALHGTAASAGTVSGIARVVLDPANAELQPGEILVAPSTDPGWTPLFLSASALVMEMGGAMSHGAVVAREYGIPAVVGVTGAIERIKTGDRIEVDGTRGVVVIAPPVAGRGG